MHLDVAKKARSSQEIETPTWAFGNAGAGSTVFAPQGPPRTPHDKIEDAATAHRFNGAATSVALHIPWDRAEDHPVAGHHISVDASAAAALLR